MKITQENNCLCNVCHADTVAIIMPNQCIEAWIQLALDLWRYLVPFDGYMLVPHFISIITDDDFPQILVDC